MYQPLIFVIRVHDQCGLTKTFDLQRDCCPISSLRRLAMATTIARRYEFDWLRILAILVVFLYHSTRFFNLGDWHVKNADMFVGIEMWIVFASTWLMPLFFIISGVSLFYAIDRSGGWPNFYKSKFLRLMVPVVVAATTHSALQIYLERLTHGQFSGSLVAFLPEYFKGIYLGFGQPGGNFAFHGTHLWYLLYLFVDSLLCYHLFIWLKGGGAKYLQRLTRLLAVPGLMHIGLSIPFLVLYAFIPPAVLNAGAGAWGFPYYLWFLIAGFIIVSSQRLQQAIQAQRWVSLLAGVGLSTIFLFRSFGPPSVVPPGAADQWVHTLIYFLNAWCWVLAILGFGMRHLAFHRPLLSYANEGVLPFYILHQTVLLGIGYFIVQMEINAFYKWVIISTESFITILVLYFLVVRRFDLMRFLFGMKVTHAFNGAAKKRWILAPFHLLYVGLIAGAVVAGSMSRTPMPLAYNPAEDIVLNCESIKTQSPTGISIVSDTKASIGKAMEFFSGASQQAQAQPHVYAEMHFSAPAGRYTLWLRGKCNQDGWADSVWLQVDDQIGTHLKSIRMGNWLDAYPAGAYAWAGDGDLPVVIQLEHTGDHRIRIQPRQTPHRIDQIWLSRSQHRIPDTAVAIH
jgi:hypothetical protein